MAVEQNKAILRRWMAAISSGNLDQVDDLVAPNYVAYQPGAPGPLDWPSQKQFARVFYTAFPDQRTTVDDVVAEGDRVVARWTFRGTHTGELMGMPPTGKTASMGGIEINRIEDGKIVEHWVALDIMGLMQQLGAVPAPAASAA